MSAEALADHIFQMICQRDISAHSEQHELSKSVL